jgi:hypothetical protein
VEGVKVEGGKGWLAGNCSKYWRIRLKAEEDGRKTEG